MQFLLKNVKHSEFASEETHCFQATLYIDGKRFCTVHNDGHGGPNDYRPITDKQPIWKQIEKINKELGQETIECGFNDPTTGKPATIDKDIDIVVDDLVNQWLQDKEIKKALRRLCYIKPDTPRGTYYRVGTAKVKPTPKNIELLHRASWWKDDYICLNELSTEELRRYL